MGKRTYGTILIDKLAREKTKPEKTPCVRYFIDENGEAITKPEIFNPDKSALLKGEEYWKAGESLKGNPNAVINKPTKQQLAEDIKTMSNQEIADKYQMGKSTIARYLSDYGLKRDEEYFKKLRSGEKGDSSPKVEHNEITNSSTEGVLDASRGSVNTPEYDCAKRDNQEVEKTVLITKEQIKDEIKERKCFGNYSLNTDCTDLDCDRMEECYLTENPPEETKDDLPFTDDTEKNILNGLVESEPAWNVNARRYILEPIKKPFGEELNDEDIWAYVGECIEELRIRARRRAEKEVMDRLLVMTGSFSMEELSK
ncbi:MAG: hypothetical protein Q8911_00350 [Bacillota bacterium]|nr:hypothetical protein [Bacillota bacterium]